MAAVRDSCSIDLIVLPHLNYAPFADLTSLNQAFSLLYFSLTELNIPKGLEVTLSLVSSTSNQDFFGELITGLKENQPDINCRALLLPDAEASLAQGMEMGLLQSQADYVLFVMPGSMFDANYCEVLLPHLQKQENIIKTGVFDKDLELLQDASAEILLKSAPELICKGFGSFVLRRKYLLEHNFLAHAKQLGFFDLGLSASLMELVRQEQQALRTQAAFLDSAALDGAHLGSNHHVEATSSVEGVTQLEGNEYTATTDSIANTDIAKAQAQGSQSADIQKFFKACPEDILKSKSHIFVTSLPYAKVYLPELKLDSAEQITLEAQAVLHVLSAVRNIPLSYVAVVLLSYFYNLPACISSELKIHKIQEGVKLYNFVYQHLQSLGAEIGQANIVRLDSMLDVLAQNPIAQSIKNQDVLMLTEIIYKNSMRSAKLRIKELFSSHRSSLLIERVLKEQLLQDCLKNQVAGPILQTVSQEQKERLLDFKLERPNFCQGHNAQELNAQEHNTQDINAPKHNTQDINAPEHNTQERKPSSVHIVSVVNNIPQYQGLFMANPHLAGHNCTLCPLLNPEPEQPDMVLGLPTLYNRFLDNFDYSKPSWLIFVHNDVEILGNLDVLSDLPQDTLYGPCGAYVALKKGLPTAVFIGHNLAQHPDSDMYFFGASQNNFRLFPKDKEKYEVDTFDCMCLIVHSSLVDKYKLRFDSNLRFDLVVEDFCISAKVQHGIKSKLVNILMNHHSATSALRLPPSYFASLKYLNNKYPKIMMAGTCSLIGGISPLEQTFKH